MVESQQTYINEVLSLVQQFARRFMRDPYDADDLAQDVLIKALGAYRRNPSISSGTDAQIAGWLKMITRNTAIDMLRSARRHEQRRQELTDIHIGSDDVESHIEAREIITVALSRLPAKERVVLLLDAQGYTSKEMAQREHITQGSVKSRLYRARVAIREVAA